MTPNCPERFIDDSPSGAYFSECGLYRYALWRRWWDDCCLTDMACFIGLNPSTADATQDDPTIRRCISFAKQWKRGGIVMLNLFAYRATDPKAMKQVTDPVGPLNDEAIRRTTRCYPLVCCWGAHGGHHNRSNVVLSIIGRKFVKHLGMTKAGQPKHPLYLPSDTQLQDYSPRCRTVLHFQGEQLEMR